MRNKIQLFATIEDHNGIRVFKFDGNEGDIDGKEIFGTLEEAKRLAIEKAKKKVIQASNHLNTIETMSENDVPVSNFLFRHYFD